MADRCPSIAPLVATPDMVQAALDLVWEDSESHDELVRNIWQAMAAVAPSAEPSPRAQGLEEAARNLIANRFDSYKARNGKLCSIEGDDGEKCWIVSFDDMAELESALSSKPVADAPFQDRVKPWMLACFGEGISNDKLERCDRFIEEALELVQAIGYSTDRAHALVDYVFNRDIGEPHQEVGGVMVTLAALCLASGLDMNKAGEDELSRIWTKVEKIRAKQAAKPTGSALPIALTLSVAERLPQDVINLVIAAREALDTGVIPDHEEHNLDKALEAFASRVRYENEPGASE